MSLVEVVLVSVAMALITAAKEGAVDEWVNANKQRVQTFFVDKNELIRTVKSCGYDVEDYYGGLKTPIGQGLFVTWEFIDGSWYAVFQKSNDVSGINAFIKDLEAKSERPLFAMNQQIQSANLQPTQSFPTNFRDPELLIKTLQEFGCKPEKHSNGDITCRIENTLVRFYPTGEGAPYDVEVEDSPALRHTFEQLLLLDEDYRRNVQALTYETLKERIKKRNMRIKSEQVLEDNSIVVTLLVDD